MMVFDINYTDIIKKIYFKRLYSVPQWLDGHFYRNAVICVTVNSRIVAVIIILVKLLNLFIAFGNRCAFGPCLVHKLATSRVRLEAIEAIEATYNHMSQSRLWFLAPHNLLTLVGLYAILHM